eukprot:m.1082578 g.1082578  ORF g.1082578 m.1082578 type:complete len:73 (+) comp24267_c0_seq5:692-910(+)
MSCQLFPMRLETCCFIKMSSRKRSRIADVCLQHPIRYHVFKERRVLPTQGSPSVRPARLDRGSVWEGSAVHH